MRVSVSVSGCDRSAGLTVTLEGPAVPGSLHVPSSGSAPPPFNSSLPAPPGSGSRPLPRGASTAGPPPPPPPPIPAGRSRSPPSTPRTPLSAPTTAESTGESRLGSPGTRVCHRGGSPGLATSERLFPPAAGPHCSPPSYPAWARETQCTPQRGIFYRDGYDEWALEM